MDLEPTYRVQFTGQFLAGVTAADAIAAFASLAKISPQQAASALSGARVLKKQLAYKVAQAYQEKLRAIGLDVALESEAPPKAALSLEPIADRHAAKSQNDSPAAAATAAVAVHGVVTCPKCGHEQTHAGQCESCGVYIHKVLSRQQSETAAPKVIEEPRKTPASIAPEEEATSQTSQDEPQDPRPVAVLAVCAVALVCAYVWKLIAVITEYEVGIVAWAIGGAIGFTAIALGSIGIRTGIICGVLALCSIVGGKYLAMDAFFDQVTGEMKTALADAGVEESWQKDIEIARHFVAEVDTDAEMRQFMVEQGYSESEQPEQISDAELQAFKDDIVPFLQNFAQNPMTADSLANMQGEEFFEQYAGVNVWDGVWESLGVIDLLFFFLGIGTAFRMGATGRVK